ncbi:hypothetical protein Q5W90_04345 [Borreliella burgdorferi]|uniref:hypothetical protein n=1 Tax=Borreliella burgdorferi TaxID=139 RepID=UPI0026F45825|nr:hypothetical protein [Borreliella burgdorferi]MDO7256696.1 hypothetical protein [Borreliella burgdorferi]MDO7279414.1 hypothetical protein [Borreliella burgdorferi]
MSKKVMLILLEILILSCDLSINKEQKTKEKTSEKQESEKQNIEKQEPEKQKQNAAKIIPTVSIQTVEIRESNQIPKSIEKYYKQAYPIQTFTLDFSITREKEFLKPEDKILHTQGKVEALSILINKKLLDFKAPENPKSSTLKNFKEIKNIENFFQNQDLLFVLTLKDKNNKNTINIMLNPPNDTQKPKDYILKDLKDTIKKGTGEKYLNPIYRFQIKNKKDYHSIDYNKVTISEKTIELDLLPHEQVFQMNKNFTKILDTITDLNNLKLVIQKELV